MALTNTDIKKIDKLILDHLRLQEDRLEEKFTTKTELQSVKEELKGDIKNLEENISHLPTKSEFYSWMDKIMGELKTVREEQTLITQHLSDHCDEIAFIKTQLHSN